MGGITLPERRWLYTERRKDPRQRSPCIGRDPDARVELRPWREFAKGAGITLFVLGVGVVLWVALSGSGWIRICSPWDIVRLSVSCY